MSKKAGPGRKTKLTPELQQRIVQVLRSGNWIETACEYVGIHPDTYYDWMKRGESDAPSNQIYRAFRKAVLEARSAAEIECVARIRMAGSKGNVKADMWFLERSFPERWGRRRVEVTGKDGEPLNPAAAEPTLSLEQLSDDELLELHDLMQRAAADSDST